MILSGVSLVILVAVCLLIRKPLQRRWYAGTGLVYVRVVLGIPPADATGGFRGRALRALDLAGVPPSGLDIGAMADARPGVLRH